MSRLLVGFISCALAAPFGACTGPRQGPSGAPTIEPLPPTDPSHEHSDAPEAATTSDSRSMIIHPLTRVGTDAAGKPAILLHLEFHDTFDQDIKAFGVARVRLTASGQGEERQWLVDLRDPKTNALMYDSLVTRTYTIPLGGLPSWLILWSTAEIKTTHVSDTAPELRVWFTPEPGKPGEQPRTLRASRKLTR